MDFYELQQQAAESHGDELGLDLIFIMRDIYINFNLNSFWKFTNSNRSIKFKGIFPWNISQVIMKTNAISSRIVINHSMKWDITFWVDGKSVETDKI